MPNQPERQINTGNTLEGLLPLRSKGNPLRQGALRRLGVLALVCGLAAVMLATILVGEWLFP